MILKLEVPNSSYSLSKFTSCCIHANALVCYLCNNYYLGGGEGEIDRDDDARRPRRCEGEGLDCLLRGRLSGDADLCVLYKISI